MRCSLTTRLARHSPGMLPTASAGWNRHQLAANVSVPAAIRGGDEVAEETPSELSDQLSVRSYCLMSNHFHLLLKPAPGQSISRSLGCPV